MTEHLTLAYNLVRNANHGINVSRTDGGSLDTNHIRIVGNVLYALGADEWGGADGGGRLFQVLDGVDFCTFEHNTGFGRASSVMFDGGPNESFVFRDNLCGPTNYGVFGSGLGEGTGALASYAPAGVFANNVIVGASGASYPAGSFFPATIGEVGFTDVAANDYRLLPSSPYATSATDGTAIGADFDALDRALAGSD